MASGATTAGSALPQAGTASAALLASLADTQPIPVVTDFESGEVNGGQAGPGSMAERQGGIPSRPADTGPADAVEANGGPAGASRGRAPAKSAPWRAIRARTTATVSEADAAAVTGEAAPSEAGDHEAGDREAGDREAGDREAGDREAGDREAGDREAGDREAGDREAGRRRISRRTLIQAAVLGGAGVASLPLIALIGDMSSNEPRPTNLVFSLNSDWLFGGQYNSGSESTFYDDSGFARVTVPHAVTPLSWRDWDVNAWQQVWIYRRH